MKFAEFAEKYLIPPDKRNDRLTRVFVYLCSAVTATAFIAATLNWLYGYTDLALQIYVSAFTFPIAFILIRISKRAEVAGHYVAANVLLQTLFLAADQAIGVIALIGIAAGAPLLGRTAGKVWLGIVLLRAIYVAATATTEIASATAATDRSTACLSATFNVQARAEPPASRIAAAVSSAVSPLTSMIGLLT